MARGLTDLMIEKRPRKVLSNKFLPPRDNGVFDAFDLFVGQLSVFGGDLAGIGMEWSKLGWKMFGMVEVMVSKKFLPPPRIMVFLTPLSFDLRHIDGVHWGLLGNF